MGNIRCLSKEIVEKIAAGEVVERPASIVKELVENSIDANASSISIEMETGGLQRLSVRDDGCGMDAEDLGRCVLRHATSKIRSSEDLFRISTMGFRGEALYAIGAVSRLTILSRVNEPGVLEGSRVDVEGGSVAGFSVAGCAAGTQVDVRDIFFNVPARKKFMRSPAVEGGHVVDAVCSLALSHPAIRFELKADGSRRLSLPACCRDGAGVTAEERVVAVLGEKFRGRLTPVDERSLDISVRGWVAEAGRASGKDVHFFLNRRPVRDRLLMHALAQAFAERETAGGGPAAVLWIEIDPAIVDVNVHPAKREVRFVRGSAVHDFIVTAVRKSLSCTQSVVMSHPASSFSESSGAAAVAGTREGVREALLRYEERRLGGQGYEVRSFAEGVQCAIPGATDHKNSMRPLGQFGLTYIACEHEDGSLVLIDQHAAHERLAYDELRAQFAEGEVHVQRLLIPERVELGAAEAAQVVERQEILSAAGFEMEPFGGGSILVKAVPEILRDAAVAPVFEKLAHELDELGGSVALADAVGRVFAVIACHSQVRAGDALSQDEIAALVRDIERRDIAMCPHGRPALVRIEKSEIEKWFKRT